MIVASEDSPVASEDTPDATAASVVRAALQADARDNVTAVVVDVVAGSSNPARARGRGLERFVGAAATRFCEDVEAV